MKKLSLQTIAFLEAAGITLYIILFATTVQQFSASKPFEPVNPFLAMSLFLLTFAFSASVCTTLFLGYPAYLFFNGKKKEAVRLVLESIVWLGVFLLILLTFVSFSLNQA